MAWKPTVKQLQDSAYGNTPWVVCPRCHGGRGALLEERDEEGNLFYNVGTCPTCQGEKVIERPRRASPREVVGQE